MSTEGSRLDNVAAGLASITQPARQLWLTILIAALLYAAVTVVELPSAQVIEALINYAPDPGQPWTGFNWPTGIITLVAFMTVARALRHWSARLLRMQPSEIVHMAAWRQLLFAFIWASPWLALAIVLVQTGQSLKTGWWTPYTLLAGLAVLIPTVFSLGALLPVSKRILAWYNTNTLLQRALDFFPIIVFFAAIVVFSVRTPGLPTEVELARLIGPPALLAFALAAFTSFCAWLQVIGRRIRLPLFWMAAGLAMIFSGFDLNDNHPITHAGTKPASPAPDFQTATLDWLRLHEDQAGAPVLIVSAEGGGIRAAYFTAMTLARIADQCPAAANRILAVSGVSGGSFGAAVYSAALKVRPIPAGELSCAPDIGDKAGWYESRIDEIFRQDHLSPILSRFLFPDTVQRFLPVPVDMFDRQLGLEMSLADDFHGSFGADTLRQPFYNLTPTATSRSIPYLFLNSTMVETGERVVATAVDMTGADFMGRPSFRSLYPDMDFPLVSLAGASARFFYISPSGHIGENKEKRRFVDGGYFDNSGATTLLEIYQSLADMKIRHPELATTPVHVIHIGNQPLKPSDPGDAGRRNFPRGFDDQVAPLRAVLKTRESRVAYSLDQLERAIARTGGGASMLKIQMADYGVAIPLGWLLSSRAADDLARQVRQAGRLCEEGEAIDACPLKTLESWFKAPPVQPTPALPPASPAEPSLPAPQPL